MEIWRKQEWDVKKGIFSLMNWIKTRFTINIKCNNSSKKRINTPEFLLIICCKKDNEIFLSL